jgi:hypothetical protein
LALPFFDTTMIHLTPNAASNVVSLSPYQARKYLATFTHYLIVLTNEATEATHAAVLAPSVDNDRETKFDLRTDADAAGEVLITQSGLYTYTVYGQNSADNTDPTDAAVVGICETGAARVTAEDAWTTPTISIPDNVVYYE